MVEGGGLQSLDKWFAFVGLLIELVGFLILAWDLLPEYWLYRQRQVADRFRGLVSDDERFNAYVHQLSDPERNPIEALVVGMREEVGPGDAMGVSELLHELGLRHCQPPSPPDRSEYRNASMAIDAALREKEGNIDRRRRPPILLGIVLVLFGVGLQLFSSWPR